MTPRYLVVDARARRAMLIDAPSVVAAKRTALRSIVASQPGLLGHVVATTVVDVHQCQRLLRQHGMVRDAYSLAEVGALAGVAHPLARRWACLGILRGDRPDGTRDRMYDSREGLIAAVIGALHRQGMSRSVLLKASEALYAAIHAEVPAPQSV